MVQEAFEQPSLKEAVREALIGLARCNCTITYRDLAILANIPSPHSINRLTRLLEELVQEDADAGRPLLASLVISRSRERIPARGFFCLIHTLGLYDGPDEGPKAREYHQEEVEMAWAYWGDGPCEDCSCR
jgi:hypothetical protein